MIVLSLALAADGHRVLGCQCRSLLCRRLWLRPAPPQLCPDMSAKQECGGTLQSPWQTTKHEGKWAEIRGKKEGTIFRIKWNKMKNRRVWTLVSFILVRVCIKPREIQTASWRLEKRVCFSHYSVCSSHCGGKEIVRDKPIPGVLQFHSRSIQCHVPAATSYC